MVISAHDRKLLEIGSSAAKVMTSVNEK